MGAIGHIRTNHSFQPLDPLAQTMTILTDGLPESRISALPTTTTPTVPNPYNVPSSNESSLLTPSTTRSYSNCWTSTSASYTPMPSVNIFNGSRVLLLPFLMTPMSVTNSPNSTPKLTVKRDKPYTPKTVFESSSQKKDGSVGKPSLLVLKRSSRKLPGHNSPNSTK